jgi:hypothetical protein
VRVGVEEAEGEDLRQEDPRPPDRHLGRVDAQPPQAVQVVDVHPLDQLHGQDPAGRVLLVDQGHVGERHPGQLRLAPLHRPALDVQVDLAPQAPLELPGDRHRLVRGQERQPALGQLREVLQDVQVGPDDLLDARPADLQRQLAAVGPDGAVDLRDRGRGQRLRVDGEELRGRAAVLLVQDRPGLGERERPHRVAQQRQLAGVRLRQDVGPGAQDLPELDERRAQILADQAEPPGPVVRRDVVAHRGPLDRPHQPSRCSAATTS